MELLIHWGLDPPHSLTPVGRLIDGQPRIWQVDGSHYLKRVEDGCTVADLRAIALCLSGQGLPAAPPLPAKDGRLAIEEGGMFYYLYQRLAGASLDDFDAQDWQALAPIAGGVIGRMHRAMEGCAPLTACRDKDISRDFATRDLPLVRRLIPEEDLAIGQEKQEQILEELRALYPRLPRQLVHGDMHGNNLLFEGLAFRGIIDLGTYAHSARVFEPVYFCGWLLWRMRQNDAAWLHLTGLLLEGYDQARPLTHWEIAAIPCLMYADMLSAIAERAQSDDREGLGRNLRMLGTLAAREEELRSMCAQWARKRRG